VVLGAFAAIAAGVLWPATVLPETMIHLAMFVMAVIALPFVKGCAAITRHDPAPSKTTRRSTPACRDRAAALLGRGGALALQLDQLAARAIGFAGGVSRQEPVGVDQARGIVVGRLDDRREEVLLVGGLLGAHGLSIVAA
jgi:hypothetical protein